MTTDEQQTEVERIAREMGMTPAQVAELALTVGLKLLAVEADARARRARVVAPPAPRLTDPDALRRRSALDQVRAAYEERVAQVARFEQEAAEVARRSLQARRALEDERRALEQAEAAFARAQGGHDGR